VVFCYSNEIYHKILESCNKTDGPIEVADIILFCISNTCASTRRAIPLWATQGIRHQKRRALCSGLESNIEISQALLEPEAPTIEQRYGSIGSRVKSQFLQGSNPSESSSRWSQLKDIRAKCQEFEVTNFDAATLLEEQGRELSPE